MLEAFEMKNLWKLHFEGWFVARCRKNACWSNKKGQGHKLWLWTLFPLFHREEIADAEHRRSFDNILHKCCKLWRCSERLTSKLVRNFCKHPILTERVLQCTCLNANRKNLVDNEKNWGPEEKIDSTSTKIVYDCTVEDNIYPSYWEIRKDQSSQKKWNENIFSSISFSLSLSLKQRLNVKIRLSWMRRATIQILLNTMTDEVNIFTKRH